MQKILALLRIAIRSIKLGFSPGQPYEWEPALEKLRAEQAERTTLARQLLPALSDASRRRFSEPVLLRLLAAGWREERLLTSEEMADLQNAAPHPFPPAVANVLREFGGLSLGLGRTAEIGTVNKERMEHLSQLELLLERRLHPIGFSNIFVDDGLVIYSDDSGRVFVDGEMGSKEPGDSRIDYLAASFDRALEILLTSPAKNDEWPGVPASGMWYYDKAPASAVHSHP